MSTPTVTLTRPRHRPGRPRVTLPIRGAYPPDWTDIAIAVKRAAGWRCARCGAPHNPQDGRCLGVHHFDGDKANCARWNLMPLCQACHLSVQARVDPQVGLLFDPSPWCMPYIAGFYESGRGVKPPTYDLAAWCERYIREVNLWPWWAPAPRNERALFEERRP